MKTLLMAASALSMLAAPAAFAQSTSTVNLTGTVGALCGAGGHSSGGTSANATQTVAISGLTDADGRVVAQDINIGFGNLWCNSAANVSVEVNELKHTSIADGTFDSSSFFNRIDMSVAGPLISLYFVDAPTGAANSAVGNGTYTGSIAHAFETGTGQYDNAVVSIIAPATDRPLAGDYEGSIVVEIAPGS